MTNALSTIEDEDGMIGGMMTAPASVNTAIQLMAAMVDKRIATARQYPRKISRFKLEASQLLREDVETARSAEYAKPVGGGTVKGASIRLAELAAMCWGNLEIDIAEPIIGDKSVTLVSTAYDLERNYRVQGIATASILKRDGSRYPQHMIETTILATASKARRNAILSAIPKAYIKDLLDVAREVAAGNKEPLEVIRKKMIEYFQRTHKVTEQQIFDMLNVGGIDDIGEPQIDELRLAANALKENEAKVEDFFNMKTESKADAVKAKIAARKDAAAKKEATPEPKDGAFPPDEQQADASAVKK